MEDYNVARVDNRIYIIYIYGSFLTINRRSRIKAPSSVLPLPIIVNDPSDMRPIS